MAFYYKRKTISYNQKAKFNFSRVREIKDFRRSIQFYIIRELNLF